MPYCALPYLDEISAKILTFKKARETNMGSFWDWFINTNTEEAERMHEFDMSIDLERQIGAQIYNALQGDIVEAVLRELRTSSNGDAYWRSNMEGHSLKVEKELLPDFYRLCTEVKNKLGFTEPVDFYITGDSSVNAFSVAAEGDNEPHIVNINSALFDLMTPEELRFVVGHELGHLINKDTKLARLIRFVFPPESSVPVSLQHKIRLHDQLAELVADRYGYKATENLDACVTAFFKMASGLDLVKMNVSIDALLADNFRRLEFFLSDKGMSLASHPVNPIRVQALNLFANAKSKEELDGKMDELISILLKVGDSEQDEYTAKFIASAGIIVANIDGEVDKREIDLVVSQLSALKIFPRQFLDEIAQGDVNEVFTDAVSNLMRINPGMREGMVRYMINIAMSDNEISKAEVEFLYMFGESVGLSKIEVAHSIAEAIQQGFVPSIDSIC